MYLIFFKTLKFKSTHKMLHMNGTDKCLYRANSELSIEFGLVTKSSNDGYKGKHAYVVGSLWSRGEKEKWHLCCWERIVAREEERVGW